MVSDRWHKSSPRPGEPVCREHGMVPSAAHGEGDRWQVRWRDEQSVQRKRNFARKTGKDPGVHADAFDAKVSVQLDDGSYVDPADANVTFRAYAEDWRRTRTHDPVTAERVEREFRLHAYPVIGHRTLRELAKRPTITQAWVAGMKPGPGTARQVIRDVSSVYIAAIDDGLIGRNPCQAQSVTRPKAPDRKAQPWALAEVGAVSAALAGRFAVLPYLGAGTGMRQGELFGLAVSDIGFLTKMIHVERQVRLVGNVRCFAPVKNRKAHGVPLADSLAPRLAEHIRRYPPVEVTLPWLVPDGEPVTFRLLVTGQGGALHRTGFNKAHWRPARKRAGIPATRWQGMHVLRHTAASAWLAAGVDIVSVAAWLGDTVATVYRTYAHLMPGTDHRGRKAMDEFFTGGAGSALIVPPAAGERR